ncbi:MAG: hypothetical protein DDT42_00164 [candidate division WS2 bacterium]|uniref:Molybdopterin-guanine dinucleotide biosynthesis protein B (MobB) domain-containing protein n=1 Tax=Psychracetigena formicireducens TaxID=2986056 RepID=A0A9E2F0G9_PSYF1|nr:hypothetical protein [Candidatus Psychracetigena formicireducens]MBT9144329.1 hypothetical protein [Candidatus Psychracetigena formicireducens]
MKVVIVFGQHKSGKTTVVESLIRGITGKGFSVASIKDIHSPDFEPDSQGTDTFRHVSAGSTLTVGLGLHKTAIFAPWRIKIDKLLQYIECDYLVIEGNLPVEGVKIFCAHSPEELPINDRSIIAISGLASNLITNSSNIPIFHPIFQEEELVNLVLENSKDIEKIV